MKKGFLAAFSHFSADFVGSTFRFNNGQTFDTKLFKNCFCLLQTKTVYICDFPRVAVFIT